MIARTIKAVFRSALNWGVGWSAVMLALIGGMTLLGRFHASAAFWPTFAARQFIGGAINGVVFALAVMIIARRRTFSELRVGQLAIGGALAGVVFPAISFALTPAAVRIVLPTTAMFVTVGVGATIGAALGAGALLMARRAPQIATPPRTQRLDAAGPA